MKQERDFTTEGREPYSFKEKKVKASAGVIVLIVGLDPNRNGENETDPFIRTIIELKNKPETNKFAGQISAPAETRKDGETIESNVLGALAEFCNDEAFSLYVRNHLVRPERWIGEKGASVGNSPVDIAVLIYDGALDFPFKPACSDEVRANGWVKKSDLINNPRSRDILKQALEFDSEKNLVRCALDSYYNNPQKRDSIFPKDMDSIEEFSVVREHGIDIRVMESSEIAVYKQLPEAKKLISGAIGLLVEAQNQEKRNYEREDQMASFLKKYLKRMARGCFEVGIDEVRGLGIKRVKATKAAWERKEYREFYQDVYHEEGHDVYKLQSGESIEKSWGGWWLGRGDRLGYPEELGKYWYLIFGRVGGSNLRDYVIVPLSGIKGLKLKPNYTGM